jgi:two-component system, NtrC family, nitrogen regulation sensor histidine kinase NtrY
VDVASGMIEKAEANEAAAPPRRRRARWLRSFAIANRRGRLVILLELLVVLVLIGTAVTTYFIASNMPGEDGLIPPPVVAGLLVANLVPAMALMVLIARRLAKRRPGSGAGKGRIHVRLVAVFSVIASVPTLLVVIFASLLFQAGLQFWFSDNARQVLASAENVSQIYAQEHRERIQLDVQTMGADMVRRINESGLSSDLFTNALVFQTAARQLEESAIITLNPRGDVQTRAAVDISSGEVINQVPAGLYERRIKGSFSLDTLRSMRAGQAAVFSTQPNRVEALVRLDPEALIYLYGARQVNAEAISQISQARTAAGAYQQTLEQSRDLQLRFNVILLLVSLFIVGFVIWIALSLADRLVRPVGALVDAARRVTAGDLSARVPHQRSRDEIGTLGQAFNRMTSRLEQQTGDLLSSNQQSETRRALIEAVLSGVSAGVLFVDGERRVRLINSSAEALLGAADRETVGQHLAQLSPELDRYLAAGEGEDVVLVNRDGDVHTLAVKQVASEGGHVLTFDDITDQLLDQRRAAWSDVARRIAHEIKNPLTPIQLAAERLQRRYGKEVESDPATFERLTGTIVRQVGDLRRMVDEFSSFARMPKPTFQREALVEIARQALFLHEVAHPDIRFSLNAPEPHPNLVCDRRLLGQALTNIVKNGVEAIQQKREEGQASGEEQIAMSIRSSEGELVIEVSDSGVGLPADRRRLTEPYMTTRTKGTGLGLAIVKKIVEEHFGRLDFVDALGGGTLVRLTFDLEMLERIGSGAVRIPEEQSVNG